MSGIEVAAPYVAAALGINALYGTVTGEEGGLVGELMGVTDEREEAATKAKADAAARQQASIDALAARIPDAPTTALPSVTPPPAAVSLAAPVAATPAPMPAPMPVASVISDGVKRQSIAQQRRRAGRASTILTQTTSDTLG